MAGNTAFFDSYDTIEITLPDGRTIRCQALPLRDAARFLRLLMASRAGDGEALLELMDAFPGAVGAEAEFQALTPAEFFDAVDRFLAHRRTPRPAGTTNGPTAAGTTPTSGSTTS